MLEPVASMSLEARVPMWIMSIDLRKAFDRVEMQHFSKHLQKKVSRGPIYTCPPGCMTVSRDALATVSRFQFRGV